MTSFLYGFVGAAALGLVAYGIAAAIVLPLRAAIWILRRIFAGYRNRRLRGGTSRSQGGR